MKYNYLKLSGMIGAVFLASITYGQVKQQPAPNFVNPFQSKTVQQKSTALVPNQTNTTTKILQKQETETVNGSFSVNLEKQKLNKENAVKNFNSLFNLNEYHSFQQISERTDELGFTHTNYQQFYKGFPIESFMIMLHSKNGLVTSANGRIAEFENTTVQISISEQEALSKAKNYLKVTDLINEYPIESLITRISNERETITKLAYRVRIDSYSPFTMCYIYVDTETGEILNKVNLIAHADVPGTGQTLYSGTQSITCDSHSGHFRLRESGRKIETYNATNSSQNFTIGGFLDAVDFTSSTSTFTGVPRITSFSISAVSQSWWYAVFADELPDLYIKIKDGSNQTVYTSGYYNNTNPPVTFNNLNIYLNNPPYTVEVWDYDAVGGDDFGGSYTINATVGTHNWSGNGNNGSYAISTSGHPALDVHWGMEKTYDFYSSVFNRDSYDGNGSVIKQYINPPTLQSQYGNTPNNASAYNDPYNFMQYGLGDGVSMNPVVSLDVEGHEFTHMVVNHNGNGGLVYQGESGALNESFADIFGTCIEFYTFGANANWTIGEDVMINSPFLRSMSNPNASQNPDTYNGTHWANPSNLSYDNGGVHINSGVQNFWFYLLSQGGSGTNDLNNPYSVTGIGINQARQIAYRNLVTYLTPNATYMDAYYGSLQATQDLYGNPSTQYTAVKQAWYAVGIGNDPNNYCSGTTNLTAPSGTITDGSGSANYNNNANCTWVIAPAGATQISLTFTAFDTEEDYDTVFVYDGPDDTYPVLATWWGNTLPPVINTSSGVGAMTVKFVSDISINAGGWSANYQAYGNTPSCDGGTILSTPTGTFSDGSGSGNYGNNQQCYWIISPPCANSVTLSFSQFNTEQGYDGVIIYDGWDNNANQLAVYSGTSLPSSITSTTGKMLVYFVSDFMATMQGFTANYTSTGSAYCSGTTTLNTSDYGTITDGSGSNNYCNNQDCSWLIQPPQATSVTLNFTDFDIEEASPDGQTIYDAVEVYDGTTTSSPLLGRFTGNNLPPAVTSSGGSMLVRFISDIEVNKQGFSAYYTSTQNPYCSGTTTTLTTPSGTFNDGSGANNYANNTNCSWLIQPANASSISLSFSAFNTEQNYDGVIVYDGTNNSAPILGQFSGTSIPNSVTSNGGSMYVEFVSDVAIRGQGWTANYTSQTLGIEETVINDKLKLYPNPTDGIFMVSSEFDEIVKLQIFDISGKEILKSQNVGKGINEINASKLSTGVYLIKFTIGNTNHTERLIIK